jgi:hypothetical protein
VEDFLRYDATGYIDHKHETDYHSHMSVINSKIDLWVQRSVPNLELKGVQFRTCTYLKTYNVRTPEP